ncbi:MAG: TonB-dependent receptor [Pseudomonadota bacterium]
MSLVGVALVAATGPVRAESGSESPSAPEVAVPSDRAGIVITGTRGQRVLADEPYAVSVIELEELERTVPRTVPEALYQLPGVLVQKTASGHGSPYIRGFTGNRTLLVIDGIRYNNATFRDGANEYFAQIDNFTLTQIEVISGPSSALYGAEAVGGVINLVTRPTSLRTQDGRFASGEQTFRVSSGDGSVTSRSALDIGEGGVWGFRGGVTLRDYGDVRAAQFGRLPETSYSERGFDARLDLALNPQWTLTLNHQNLRQDDVPRTHSTIFSVPFAGTVRGTDLVREKDHRRSLSYAKLIGDSEADWLRSFEVTASYQSRREGEQRVRADGLAIEQGFISDLFALSAVANAGLGRFELTYGFDLSRETIDSSRRDTDPVTGAVAVRLQGPVGTDASYDQAGGFVRGLADLGGGLSLEASLRGSYIAADVGRFADPLSGEAIAFADDWFDVSGSLRAIFAWQDQRIWGAYSRSFRAPNIADISRFGRSRSNEIEVASLNLSEEQFDTFEIGYRYAGDGLALGVSVYTTSLDDFIATVPTGAVREGLNEVAKRNAASGRVSGMEVSGEVQFTQTLALTGNATWLRGRLTTPLVDGPVTEPLSRVQPLSGNLALRWEKKRAWANLELSIFGRADELSSGDLADLERIPPGGTPGYALVNLRAGVEVSPSLSLNAVLANALDEAYRSHGSGSNEPGRHIAISAQIRF